MIVVVADSGPVRYLAVLNAIGVLPKLYDRIILPRSVVEELSHPHAPVEAREWAGNLPSWAEVRQARQIGLAAVLDAGEAEASPSRKSFAPTSCYSTNTKPGRSPASAASLSPGPLAFSSRPPPGN